MELVIRNNSSKIKTMIFDIIVILLAFFWFIEIKIVGRLFLLELVYLIIAVVLILSPACLSLSPFLRKFFVLLAVWLLGLMFADWYWGTSFVDYARGWSKVFFFGINVFVIYQLCRNKPRRLFLYLFGLALGGLVQPSFFPENLFLEGGTWKFGYGFPVTILTILAAYYFSVNLRMVTFGLALLNLGLGYRSMALFCLAGSMLSIWSKSPSNISINKKLAFFTKISFIILVVGISSYVYYEFGVVKSSIIDLGQVALEGEAKNPLYGRLEFIGGLKAVWDSPLIGRGSYPRDPYYSQYMELLAESLGKGWEQKDYLIPTHSFVLGAWVEAGILGALFWLFVLFESVKSMTNLLYGNIRSIELCGFLISLLIWGILFSPLSGNERIFIAFCIVVVNWVLTEDSSYNNNLV
jgi:O-antigen ligase